MSKPHNPVGCRACGAFGTWPHVAFPATWLAAHYVEGITLKWKILVDEETGDITTLWHDDICTTLLCVTEADPFRDVKSVRVGEVEFEADRGGWTARDRKTGELLDDGSYLSRNAAVEMEQKALFKRYGGDT